MLNTSPRCLDTHRRRHGPGARAFWDEVDRVKASSGFGELHAIPIVQQSRPDLLGAYLAEQRRRGRVCRGLPTHTTETAMVAYAARPLHAQPFRALAPRPLVATVPATSDDGLDPMMLLFAEAVREKIIPWREVEPVIEAMRVGLVNMVTDLPPLGSQQSAVGRLPLCALDGEGSGPHTNHPLRPTMEDRMRHESPTDTPPVAEPSAERPPAPFPAAYRARLNEYLAALDAGEIDPTDACEVSDAMGAALAKARRTSGD